MLRFCLRGSFADAAGYGSIVVIVVIVVLIALRIIILRIMIEENVIFLEAIPLPLHTTTHYTTHLIPVTHSPTQLYKTQTAKLN